MTEIVRERKVPNLRKRFGRTLCGGFLTLPLLLERISVGGLFLWETNLFLKLFIVVLWQLWHMFAHFLKYH